MLAITITTDSSADLPLWVREEFGGIHYMHIPVLLEGKSGRDGLDMFAQDIFEAFTARGAMPKTAAPSPDEYQAFFEQFTAQGSAVVHISVNSKFSSCYDFACRGAQQAQGEVYVADSRNFCIGQGMLCIQACLLREQGMAAADIAAQLEQDRARVKTSYYLHGLDFVAKSGRCPAIVALGAAWLNLHPAVSVNGATGELVIGKKYRGNHAPELWLRDSVKKFDAECSKDICLFGCTPDIPAEKWQPMESLAHELLGGFVRLRTAAESGCVVVSHVGGNCYVMAGMQK